METFYHFIIIIVATLLSAFFTANEVAMVSILKMQIDIDLNPESLVSKIKKNLKSEPGKYVATLLIGNSLTFVLFIFAFAGLLLPVFEKSLNNEFLVITATIFVSAILFLVIGKLVPKSVFPLLPFRFLHGLPLLLLFFYFLFYPLIKAIIALEKWLGVKTPHRLKDKDETCGVLFNRIGLNWIYNSPEDEETEKEESVETEVKLFKNALDFSKVKLREIMVPRTEIEMLDVSSTVEELRQKFVETGYSRIVFYDNNIDNIVGYIHSSVIFKNPTSLKPYINNVLIVPETMPANKLFSTFIQEHRSIAIVVDEFGGTSGLVTSEDILEEIFGEIEDEHDTTDIIEKQLSENEFIFSGRSEIDLINEKYNIDLPESEDFETLAGFILFHHESIPTINSIIKIDTFHFKILKATNTRIELVKLTIKEE
jgi:CBS domain containing-hemolysin-like protein